MNEHQYSLRTEHLQGQIRVQKVTQLQHRLQQETLKTEGEKLRVGIEKSRVQGIGWQLKAQEQKTRGENLKYAIATTQTALEGVNLTMAKDRLASAQTERQLKLSTITANLENMSLSLTEARTNNQRRTKELGARGIHRFLLPGRT